MPFVSGYSPGLFPLTHPLQLSLRILRHRLPPLLEIFETDVGDTSTRCEKQWFEYIEKSALEQEEPLAVIPGSEATPESYRNIC